MFEEGFLNIKLIYVSLLRPSNVFNRLIRPSSFGVTKSCVGCTFTSTIEKVLFIHVHV